MKITKILIIAGLLLALPSSVNAQEVQNNATSSPLQNQGSALQGSGQSVQNTPNNTQGSANSLDKLSGGQSVPLAPTPISATPSEEASLRAESTLLRNILIFLVALGAIIVLLLAWGVYDNKKVRSLAQPEPTVTKPPKKKKPKSKRKKAHR